MVVIYCIFSRKPLSWYNSVAFPGGAMLASFLCHGPVGDWLLTPAGTQSHVLHPTFPHEIMQTVYSQARRVMLVTIRK